MPHVLLINPSDRKTRKAVPPKSIKGKKMAKHRTPAQMRATRKMIAANRARSRPMRPKRRAVSKVSRAKPQPRMSNPTHRSKRRAPRTTVTQARAAGKALRYRRKNPSGGIGEFVSQTLMPSAIGGAGALALDVLFGVLPLPPALKVGSMAPIVKVAGAVGLGLVAGMVTSKRTAQQFAAGALTVTLYNMAKTTLNRLSGGKIPGLSEYVSGYDMDMAAYVSGDQADQIGYAGSGLRVDESPSGQEMAGYETGVYR